MALPVFGCDGDHPNPPAPREPVPAVGQGIFNITNLLRPDIQDSIQIFPAPPLRGLWMVPITPRVAA